MLLTQSFNSLITTTYKLVFALILASVMCLSASGNARGKQLYAACIACHGPEGQGVVMFKSPQIAGQSQFYVETQLMKFKNGIRGSHPMDVEGMQMKAMAMTLPTEADVKTVAEYIATLKPQEKAPTITTGDAEKGKTLYVTCLACHADKGQGNELLKSPSLQHLQDWYMLAQLKKFKEGIRGANPKDITGMQMRPMAMILADEQAMKDVIAYIQTISK